MQYVEKREHIMKTLFFAMVIFTSLMSRSIAETESAYKPSATCKFAKPSDPVVSHAPAYSPDNVNNQDVKTDEAKSAQG